MEESIMKIGEVVVNSEEKEGLKANLEENPTESVRKKLIDRLKMVRPEIQKKELRKSEFSPETMVEVSSVIGKAEIAWLPAIIIKEIDDDEKKKMFIVKYCNKHYNNNVVEEIRSKAIVDSNCVRPALPFPSGEEEYELFEHVEVFCVGLGWRQGLVSDVLSEKHYMVSLESTTEESVFQHSDLRRFQVWEDGVWHNGTKKALNLPFVKTSPFWKTFEETERFKSFPQSPHFSSLLLEANETLRELSALGMMVTFYGLLDEVRDLKLDDDDASIDRLHRLSDSLTELEKHGFEVSMPKSRIRKVLSLKERREKKAEERKRFQIKIEEDDSEIRRLKEKIDDLERMKKAAKEEKEALEKNVIEMKSNVQVIDQEMEDMELQYLNIVSAPW